MAKVKAAKIVLTVEAKHQRGKYWAEQAIRNDAARVEEAFGVPVRVTTERSTGWFSSKVYGRIEFVGRYLKGGSAAFYPTLEGAIKGRYDPELWMHYRVDGSVVEVNA